MLRESMFERSDVVGRSIFPSLGDEIIPSPQFGNENKATGDQYTREKNITKGVDDLFDAFDAKLRWAAATPAKYPEAVNLLQAFNWRDIKERTKKALLASGANWDDLVQQEKEIFWEEVWIKGARGAEVGYATSGAYLTIIGLAEEMSKAELVGASAALLIQALIVLAPNIYAVDPSEARSNHQPIIQISHLEGTSTLYGGHVTDEKGQKTFSLTQETPLAATAKAKGDVVLKINPMFVPGTSSYRPKVVQYSIYQQSIKKQLEEKEWILPRATACNSVANDISFLATNIFGGACNAPSFLLFLQWLCDTQLALDPQTSLIIQASLGITGTGVFCFLGHKYYKAMVGPTVQQAKRIFCSSKNPLVKAKWVHPAMAFESGSQWLPNSALRGLAITLGFLVILSYVNKYLDGLGLGNVPYLAKLIIAGFVFTCVFHNTANTRFKAADIFLKDFEEILPVLLGNPEVIPDRQILDYKQTLSKTTLSPGEIAKKVIWALYEGSSWGVPIFIFLYYGQVEWVASLISAATGFILKGSSSYFAQTQKLKNSKAKAQIYQDIGYIDGKETIEVDSNGHPKLTGGSPEIARLVDFLVWMDQLQRIGMGIGAWKVLPLFEGYTDAQIWIGLGLLRLSIVFNEFLLYFASTKGPLTRAANGIREYAGTPPEKRTETSLCGLVTSPKYFISRQAVWLFPCFFGAIPGVSSSCWAKSWFLACCIPWKRSLGSEASESLLSHQSRDIEMGHMSRQEIKETSKFRMTTHFETLPMNDEDPIEQSTRYGRPRSSGCRESFIKGLRYLTSCCGLFGSKQPQSGYRPINTDVLDTNGDFSY